MAFIEGSDGSSQPRDIPSRSIFDGLPITDRIIIQGERQIGNIKSRLGEMERTGQVALSIVEVFGDDIQLHACIVGLLPEVGAFHPTITMQNNSFPIVLDVIQDEAPNLLVFQHPPVSWNERPLGIINLDAAQSVVARNSDIFPESARADLISWLRNSSGEWFPSVVDKDEYLDYDDPERDVIDVRMGLLSGYPREASLINPRYQRAKNKSEKDRSDSERELIANARIIEYLNGKVSFFGFSEEDERFAQRIDDIANGIKARLLAKGLVDLLSPMVDKIPDWIREELARAHDLDQSQA